MKRKGRGRGRGRVKKVLEAPTIDVPSWLNDYEAKYFHCPNACSDTTVGYECFSEFDSLERKSANLVTASGNNHEPRIIGYFIPLEPVEEVEVPVKKAPSIKWKGPRKKRRRHHHWRKLREDIITDPMKTSSDNQNSSDSAILVTDQVIPLVSPDFKVRSRGRPRKDDSLLNSAKVLSRHQPSICQPAKSSFIPPIRNVSFGERCNRCSLVQSLSTNRKKLSFEGEPLRPLVVV